MGKFGTFLATELDKLGDEVMIVDKDPEVAAELVHKFENIQIADCTKREVLEELNVKDYDVCFVAIDEDFQSSLEITSLLSELGAKCIVSKTSRESQEKFLLKFGANEVVYPDKDSAEKTAVKYHARNVVEYIPIGNDYNIYEMPIPDNWVGKSILDLDVRKAYKINVLAIKKGEDVVPAPLPAYVFEENDHVLIMGKQIDVLKLDKKI